jgi:hypothetical protein
MDQCSFRYPGTDTGPAVGLADEVLGPSPPEALAVGVDEEGRGGAELAFGVVRLTSGEVVRDHRLQGGLDRHEADLGTLAGDL